jgi:adenylylsulfate kinase
MTDNPNNLHPTFHKILKRSDKESLLKQKAQVIWLTGLSGAGKTTIAKGLEQELHNRGYLTQVLDGDNIRSGINNNLGFSEADRYENIRRIAEVSKLFIDCGIITINCFISPTDEIRDLARRIIGPENFIEVFVNASFEECEKRDVKGLYSKARRGEIRDFTGIDSPFDPPLNCAIEIRTDRETAAESVDNLLRFVLPRIDPANIG